MGKPPFSYGFPMVFLWFSYGFPHIIPVVAHRSPDSAPGHNVATQAQRAARRCGKSPSSVCRDATSLSGETMMTQMTTTCLYILHVYNI